MRNLYHLFIAFIFCAAIVCCRSHRPSSTSNDTLVLPDSLTIAVTCFNLSENLTKNDELLLITYRYNDFSDLDDPLFYEKFKLDLKNTARLFQRKLNEDLSGKSIILFLLEQDSETPVQQIDSTLRIHHRELIREHQTRNYSGIEKYLGDEDILGIKIISNMNYSEFYTFYFTGIYKLDKYEYEIKVGNNMKREEK